MAVDFEKAQRVCAEYGFAVELYDLETYTIVGGARERSRAQGYVAIISGPVWTSSATLLDEISKRLIDACPQIVRVVIDITTPPKH